MNKIQNKSLSKIPNSIVNRNAVNNMNDYQEQLKSFVKTISSNFEGAVPEYGDFVPYFEFLQNKDKKVNILKYGIKVYKMPNDIESDSKMRFLEAAVYLPDGEYKMDMLLAKGYKNDLKNFINSEDFIKQLNDAYEKLIQKI